MCDPHRTRHHGHDGGGGGDHDYGYDHARSTIHLPYGGGAKSPSYKAQRQQHRPVT